jgi:hypothetical protein
MSFTQVYPEYHPDIIRKVDIPVVNSSGLLVSLAHDSLFIQRH